jgi:hypothetical protein
VEAETGMKIPQLLLRLSIAEAAAVMAEHAALAPAALAPESDERHQCFRPDCERCQATDRVAAARRAKRAEKVGCRCGTANCDCAQWERIFREKFEDPNYYSRGLTLRTEHPLS